MAWPSMTTFNGKGPFSKTFDADRLAPDAQRSPFPRKTPKTKTLFTDQIVVRSPVLPG